MIKIMHTPTTINNRTSMVGGFESMLVDWVVLELGGGYEKSPVLSQASVLAIANRLCSSKYVTKKPLSLAA